MNFTEDTIRVIINTNRKKLRLIKRVPMLFVIVGIPAAVLLFELTDNFIYSLLFVWIVAFVTITVLTNMSGLRSTNDANVTQVSKIVAEHPAQPEYIGQIIHYMNTAKNISARTHIAFFLAQLYSLNGNFDAAIDLLLTCDRSFIANNDSYAVEYYTILMEAYCSKNDLRSAELVYNDAVKVIERGFSVNNPVAVDMVQIEAIHQIICGNKSVGLSRLILLANELNGSYDPSRDKEFTRIVYVTSRIANAERYIELGDLTSAKNSLDAARDLLYGFPYQTQKFGEVEKMLNDIIAKQNINK